MPELGEAYQITYAIMCIPKDILEYDKIMISDTRLIEILLARRGAKPLATHGPPRPGPVLLYYGASFHADTVASSNTPGNNLLAQWRFAWRAPEWSI